MTPLQETNFSLTSSTKPYCRIAVLVLEYLGKRATISYSWFVFIERDFRKDTAQGRNNRTCQKSLLKIIIEYTLKISVVESLQRCQRDCRSAEQLDRLSLLPPKLPASEICHCRWRENPFPWSSETGETQAKSYNQAWQVTIHRRIDLLVHSRRSLSCHSVPRCPFARLAVVLCRRKPRWPKKQLVTHVQVFMLFVELTLPKRWMRTCWVAFA